MAFGLRNNHDTNYGAHNETSRWPEISQDDWQGLLESYSPNWSVLQFESDLRKLDILVLECLIHSNAQGMLPHC